VLLDEALAGLDELLGRESTRAFIAAELSHNAPFLKMMSDLFHLKLDEKAARKIVDVAVKKIGEVRHDGEHDLRKRFDAFVAGFIERLKRDESLRGKVARLRDEALANPALAVYIGSLWQEFRDWLDADLRRPESAVRRNLALALASFSAKLEGEPAIQRWIDEQILAALPALVEEHRSKIGRFIEDQINAWQETRLVEELERHIGPDLQFIRINGTVVGALAGLAIASLAHWLA